MLNTVLVNSVNGNKTCIDLHMSSTSIDTAIFDPLSDYDIFILGRLLLKNNGSINDAMLEKGLSNHKFLEQYCHSGVRCNSKQIDEYLSNVVAQTLLLLDGSVWFCVSNHTRHYTI